MGIGFVIGLWEENFEFDEISKSIGVELGIRLRLLWSFLNFQAHHIHLLSSPAQVLCSLSFQGHVFALPFAHVNYLLYFLLYLFVIHTAFSLHV